MNNIAEKAKSLPTLPGIYKFLDKKSSVIYIGKANNLRSRVLSYFSKTEDLSDWKKDMVKNIKDVETIISDSETEALILESIEIKKHRPKYNIVLKDDKSYGFIKIDYSEKFPTVCFDRKKKDQKGKIKYYGPYTSGRGTHQNLSLLRRIFPFKKNNKKMSVFEINLLEKRSIGQIPQSEEDYKEMIKNFEQVIKGRINPVEKILREKMKILSMEKKYEQAAKTRDQIKWLDILKSKQKMVSSKSESRDAISIFEKNGTFCANVFIIREGILSDKINFLLGNCKGKSKKEILTEFISQYYSQNQNKPKEIIVLEKPNLSKKEFFDIKIITPKKGKKYDLLKLGEKNAAEYLEKNDKKTSREKNALDDLKKVLNSKSDLSRIEGYDIANIQGTMSTGSMVVFEQGRPNPKEYKKFKIKTVKGPDDFASIAEVIKRRFRHLSWKTPDLIVIDGGKGQLSATISALSEKIFEKNVLIISLAKKNEEVFAGQKLEKIDINPKSEASMLLQRIRNEAHRFAREYHHLLRSKSIINKK